jgi:hypothetical protein
MWEVNHLDVWIRDATLMELIIGGNIIRNQLATSTHRAKHTNSFTPAYFLHSVEFHPQLQTIYRGIYMFGEQGNGYFFKMDGNVILDLSSITLGLLQFPMITCIVPS